MNRTADVTPEGDYESSFSDPGRILGAALENLSTGRMGISQEGVNNLICAITISIRYAAIRKQFGPNGNGNGNSSTNDNVQEELPLVEYQLHVSFGRYFVNIECTINMNESSKFFYLAKITSISSEFLSNFFIFTYFFYLNNLVIIFNIPLSKKLVVFAFTPYKFNFFHFTVQIFMNNQYHCS